MKPQEQTQKVSEEEFVDIISDIAEAKLLASALESALLRLSITVRFS